MDTIEYIGPRPRKAPRKSWGGGWLMIFFVVIGVGIAARPLISKALANRAPVTELKVEETVSWLETGGGFANRLAAVALQRTKKDVSYDDAYYKVGYPMGDIPASKGMCTDLIIRSYREMGMDLQELLHEDIKSDFRIYPQLWGLSEPDPNIDHRRVPNLQRYFSRHGETIEFSDDKLEAANFDYGDIVVWRLPHGDTHIGIVVPGPGERRGEKWIVHNIGAGPEWENKLLEYQLIGHYRYHTGHAQR